MEEPLYLMPEDVLYEVTVETSTSTDNRNRFDALPIPIHKTSYCSYAVHEEDIASHEVSVSSSSDTEDMDTTSKTDASAIVNNGVAESSSHTTIDIPSKISKTSTRVDTLSSPIHKTLDCEYLVQEDIISLEMSDDDIISVPSSSDTDHNDTSASNTAYPNSSMNEKNCLAEPSRFILDATSKSANPDASTRAENGIANDNTVEDTTLNTTIVLSESDESSSESSSSDTEDENIAPMNINGPCEIPFHTNQTSTTKPSVIFQKLVSLPSSQSNMGGTSKTAKPYACMVLNNCKSAIPSHIRVGQTVFKRSMPESSEICRKRVLLPSHTAVDNSSTTTISKASTIINSRKSVAPAFNGTDKNAPCSSAPRPSLIHSQPQSRTLVSTASQTDLSNSSRTENAANNSEVEKNSSVTKTHVTNTKDLRSMNVIVFCQKVGLLAKRFKCDCGAWMGLRRRTDAKADGYQWRCRKYHEKNISIKSGTFFYVCQIEMKTVLEIMYMWLYQCPIKFIMSETEIGKMSLRVLINKLKNICVAHLETNTAPIGGEDKVVEISEALFEINLGRKKSSKCYGQDKGLWVFGGIEEGTTQCFFVTMPNEKSRTLSKAMKRYILPNTTVSTTYFKAFKCLEDDDFDNLIQLHGLKFKDKIKGTFMTRVEMLWEFSKKRVSREEHFSKKVSLAQYLYLKSANNVPDPFMKFLTDAAAIHPPIDTAVDLQQWKETIPKTS